MCLFYLGFLLLKIKHVTLAALTTNWGFEPSKGCCFQTQNDFYKHTPIKHLSFVHSHPAILSITKNCIEWDFFLFDINRCFLWWKETLLWSYKFPSMENPDLSFFFFKQVEASIFSINVTEIRVEESGMFSFQTLLVIANRTGVPSIQEGEMSHVDCNELAQ